MSTVNAFYDSPHAAASMVKAFMAQSRASVLQNLSFFSRSEPIDTVDFSQMALQGSMFSTIMQGGNSSVFGSLYEDFEAFNQSLMSSVSAAAGFKFSNDGSLLGQLVNQLG